jgi:hypothetical protein
VSAMTIDRVDFKKVFTNIGELSVEVHITAHSGAHAVTMRVDNRLNSLDVEARSERLKKI